MTKDGDNESKERLVDDIIDEIGFGMFHIKILIIFGLCQTVDAMEMLLLAVIGPELKCYWSLSDAEVALITTFVFIGMCFGALFFGWVADSYGRLRALVLSTLLTILFALLSGLAPSYVWILVSRMPVGIGIGGILSCLSTLFTELTPKTFRSKGLVIIFTFWSFGGLFECALAYFITPTLGWRWLVIVSSFPLLISAVGFLYLPESPRFLLLSGQHDRARDVLNKIARANGFPEFQGRLRLPPAAPKAQFKDIFHKNYLLTTILLLCLWFSCGFGYYGNILLSTTLPTTSHRCIQNGSMSIVDLGSAIITDDSCCVPLITKDYVALTIASLGELPSFLMLLFFNECFGRRWSLRINAFLATVTFFIFNFCLTMQMENVVFFLNRSVTFSTYITAFIYSSEIYPTSIRSLAVGTCSALSRIGGITTPFIAQYVLTMVSGFGALMVYTSVSLAGCLAAICLPIETKGRILQETVHSGVDIKEEDGTNPLKDASDPLEYSTFKKAK